MVRKHIIFYGSVQGVGFRWRARNAAEHFSCTGWAKNEWDGSVSMEIQGEEEDIDRVILAIEKGTFERPPGSEKTGACFFPAFAGIVLFIGL